jgi:hypothetical protein
MAYTVAQSFLVMEWTDEREDSRLRIVEKDVANTIINADVVEFDTVSKSALKRWYVRDVQFDAALAGAADSEVSDTLRLFFDMGVSGTYHADIPDPHDDLFLSTTGPGANIVKDKADLAAGGVGTPELALSDIIDKFLAGDYLISDGETPVAYLYGERI